MRFRFTLLFFTLYLVACNEQVTIDNQPKKEEILLVLDSQQKAWNEGNIDNFMEGYWKSDSLTFIGSKGITKGWQQTLDNYKKSYPNTDVMGKLSFDVISLVFLGTESAQMIGKYTLVRNSDEPSGYFTLIWQKKNGNWVIISDQTCG